MVMCRWDRIVVDKLNIFEFRMRISMRSSCLPEQTMRRTLLHLLMFSLRDGMGLFSVDFNLEKASPFGVLDRYSSPECKID